MKMISTMLLTSLLCAVPFTFAESEPVPFEAYTLADQHGTEHTLQPETRTVIMSFEMSLSKAFHKWLATQEPDYLKTHHAEYVVDISGMPRIITKLFAGPKMKRYKFPIIQAKSKEFAAGYPQEKGKMTLLLLDAAQQTATVQYLATPAEIAALLEPGNAGEEASGEGSEEAE